MSSRRAASMLLEAHERSTAQPEMTSPDPSNTTPLGIFTNHILQNVASSGYMDSLRRHL